VGPNVGVDAVGTTIFLNEWRSELKFLSISTRISCYTDWGILAASLLINL